VREKEKEREREREISIEHSSTAGDCGYCMCWSGTYRPFVPA